MTSKPWVPFVNTIPDGRMPIAHYADPARRFDPYDPAHTITESGEWIFVDCGYGFAPAVPALPYDVCPECEAKRTPASVLVLVDCTWTDKRQEAVRAS